MLNHLKSLKSRQQLTGHQHSLYTATSCTGEQLVRDNARQQPPRPVSDYCPGNNFHCKTATKWSPAFSIYSNFLYRWTFNARQQLPRPVSDYCPGNNFQCKTATDWSVTNTRQQHIVQVSSYCPITSTNQCETATTCASVWLLSSDQLLIQDSNFLYQWEVTVQRPVLINATTCSSVWLPAFFLQWWYFLPIFLYRRIRLVVRLFNVCGLRLLLLHSRGRNVLKKQECPKPCHNSQFMGGQGCRC